NPAIVDGLIGPEGGVLSHPSGAKIVVPAGALAPPTRLTLAGVAAPSAGALGAEPLGQAFEAGPEGQVFLKPVDVSVPVDPPRLAPGSDAKNVRVRMAPHGASSFSALQSTVDLVERSVRASTLHFTDFVPAADPNPIFITSDSTLPQATVGIAYAEQLAAV